MPTTPLKYRIVFRFATLISEFDYANLANAINCYSGRVKEIKYSGGPNDQVNLMINGKVVEKYDWFKNYVR